jgi:MvaI/BcnI restriction endonuclease family
VDRRLLTKEQMAEQLRRVRDMGWLESRRPLNSGGIGNTIDHLLGLSENNLPIADTAEWELKTHRAGSSSLITLFHVEPRPRSVVPRHLLPKYGWPDAAGRPNELSFRQTLVATRATDRGFRIALDDSREFLRLAFDSRDVGTRHQDWLASVHSRAGGDSLNPEPHWVIRDVARKVSTKMLNSFYVVAEARLSGTGESFRVASISILEGFSTDGFLAAISDGGVYVDFDARTHHNHGTKFRLREDVLPKLYRYVDRIV